MEGSSAKRRKLSAAAAVAVDGLSTENHAQANPTTPTRPSYQAPTESSLSRSHPKLLSKSPARSRSTVSRGKSLRLELLGSRSAGAAGTKRQSPKTQSTSIQPVNFHPLSAEATTRTRSSSRPLSPGTSSNVASENTGTTKPGGPTSDIDGEGERVFAKPAPKSLTPRPPLTIRQPAASIHETVQTEGDGTADDEAEVEPSLPTFRPRLVPRQTRTETRQTPRLSTEPDLPPTPVQLGLSQAPPPPRGLGSSSSPRTSRSGSGRNRRRMKGEYAPSSPLKPKDTATSQSVRPSRTRSQKVVEHVAEEAPESDAEDSSVEMAYANPQMMVDDSQAQRPSAAEDADESDKDFEDGITEENDASKSDTARTSTTRQRQTTQKSSEERGENLAEKPKENLVDDDWVNRSDESVVDEDGSAESGSEEGESAEVETTGLSQYEIEEIRSKSGEIKRKQSTLRRLKRELFRLEAETMTLDAAAIKVGYNSATAIDLPLLELLTTSANPANTSGATNMTTARLDSSLLDLTNPTTLGDKPLLYLTLFAPGNVQLNHSTRVLIHPATKAITQRHVLHISPPNPYPAHLFGAMLELLVDPVNSKIKSIKVLRWIPNTRGHYTTLRRWIDARLASPLHKLDITTIIWGIGRYWEECLAKSRGWVAIEKRFFELSPEHAKMVDDDVFVLKIFKPHFNRSRVEIPIYLETGEGPGGGKPGKGGMLDPYNLERYPNGRTRRNDGKGPRVVVKREIEMEWCGEATEEVVAEVIGLGQKVALECRAVINKALNMKAKCGTDRVVRAVEAIIGTLEGVEGKAVERRDGVMKGM